MKARTEVRIVFALLFFGSLGVIQYYTNWKVAVALVVFCWALNIEQSLKAGAYDKYDQPPPPKAD